MNIIEYRNRLRFRELFKAITLQAAHQGCMDDDDDDEFYPDNLESRADQVALANYSEGYQRGFHHGVAQAIWKYDREGRDGAKQFELWSWNELPPYLKASVEFESWGPPKP